MGLCQFGWGELGHRIKIHRDWLELERNRQEWEKAYCNLREGIHLLPSMDIPNTSLPKTWAGIRSGGVSILSSDGVIRYYRNDTMVIVAGETERGALVSLRLNVQLIDGKVVSITNKERFVEVL